MGMSADGVPAGMRMGPALTQSDSYDIILHEVKTLPELDAIIADRVTFRDNARLAVKPRFVPDFDASFAFHHERIVDCLPAFVFDLAHDDADAAYFARFFDVHDARAVGDLVARFFGSQAHSRFLQLDEVVLRRRMRIEQERTKLMQKDAKTVQRLEFVRRTLCDPRFDSARTRAALPSRDRKMWAWARGHARIEHAFAHELRFSGWRFLVEHAPAVRALFTREHCELSVAQQLDLLAKADERFVQVSHTMYRRFLKRVLCFGYGPVKVAHANCDSPGRKEERRVACLALVYLLSRDVPV